MPVDWKNLPWEEISRGVVLPTKERSVLETVSVGDKAEASIYRAKSQATGLAARQIHSAKMLARKAKPECWSDPRYRRRFELNDSRHSRDIARWNTQYSCRKIPRQQKGDMRINYEVPAIPADGPGNA